MVNKNGTIIHKVAHKKGCRHDYDIYKKNHPIVPNHVVNVFDLGYLGVEKDFPEQLLSTPNRKKRNLLQISQHQKKNTVCNMLKKEW